MTVHKTLLDCWEGGEISATSECMGCRAFAQAIAEEEAKPLLAGEEALIRGVCESVNAIWGEMVADVLRDSVKDKP